MMPRNAHIRFFAPPACRQEPADHIIERVGLRQFCDVDVEPPGELLRHPVEQQARSAVGRDQQQFRPHDRDDPPFLDEA